MKLTTVAAAILALCCAPLLSGCGTSPQYSYYLLSAPGFAPPTGSGPAVGLGPVEVAEYLAGDVVVYGLHGHELEVAKSGRWAEPLSDGITRVLAMRLAQELDTQDVRRFPWTAADAPPFAVRVRVLELNAVGGEAILVAEWSLYRAPQGTVLERRISRLQTPLDPGVPLPGGIAPAYSDLLAQLADSLAGQLRSALESERQPPVAPQED